jgi:predicted CxxxxCH...CXXCH cytochrome family protein
MAVRKRRFACNTSLDIGDKAGIVKLAVLLPLTVLFLLMVFTTGAKNTTAQDCDCGFCHGDNHHGDNWTGCSGCHDSPPQTGTHRLHYNSDPIQSLRYGDITVTSTPEAYKFGCGNCHPLDRAKHNNGTLEVELYDTAAPAGSIKEKNPLNAAYTPGGTVTTYPHKIAGQPAFSYSNGTCNNVYCHSGYTVTSSGTVGNPLTTADDPSLFPPGYKISNGFIMDETCSSVTYAPYSVNSGREYKTTPAWGTTGSFSLCTECHQFPLTTWGPSVQAGVGDSHQWYNDWEGWNYGHANNMDYFPGIPCATCHYGTANHRPGSPPPYPLDSSNTPTYWTADNRPTYWMQVNGLWIKGYYTVPLKSRVMHVNGKPDVNFDTVNGYRYFYYCPPGNYGCWDINEQKDLSLATYDPANKTCSNVACHYNPTASKWQKKVKWGAPYRGWYAPGEECDQCHRMGYLSETCTTP